MTKARTVEFVAVGLVWLALWPFHELAALWVSFPLRLMATIPAVGFLQVLGCPVTHELTTVTLAGGPSIVIADACSGIDGIIAFLLAGWIAARLWQRSLPLAAFNYAFVLPSIVLANVVRLVVTVLLYRGLGPVILEAFCHRLLGYGQLALAFLLFWGVACLIRTLGGEAHVQD